MSKPDNRPFCLNADYSTTRRVTDTMPTVENPLEAKFPKMLFLPAHPGRKGEGGLRPQGHFKTSDWGQADGLPLITVITAVFNAAPTIEKCIRSVITQSYDNLEYLIIDGGSTDGTLEIIRQYEEAIDYWVSEPDEGIYDAWNKGVRLATGDWLAFLGADDSYLPGAIDAYAAAIVDCRDRLLEYISSRVNLTTGTIVKRTVGLPWIWKSFRKHPNVAHTGSLHNRTLFQRYGLYDTSYKICGDYEFLLRPRSGLRAAYLDAITVNMGLGGASDNNLLAFRETVRAKVTTGGRSALLSHMEGILAMVKWKLRKWLWY